MLSYILRSLIGVTLIWSAEGIRAQENQIKSKRMLALNKEILRAHHDLVPEFQHLTYSWQDVKKVQGFIPGFGDHGCRLILFDQEKDTIEKLKLPYFDAPHPLYLEGTTNAIILRSPSIPQELQKTLFIQLPLPGSSEKTKVLAQKLGKLIDLCSKRWLLLSEKAWKLEEKYRHFHSCQVQDLEEVRSFISQGDADFSQFLHFVDASNRGLLENDIVSYVRDLHSFFPDSPEKRKIKASDIIRRLNYYSDEFLPIMKNDPRYLSFLNDVESLGENEVNRELDKIKNVLYEVKRHYLQEILQGLAVNDQNNKFIIGPMLQMLKRNVQFLDVETAYEVQEAMENNNPILRFLPHETKNILASITHHKLKNQGLKSFPHPIDFQLLPELLDLKEMSANYSIQAVDRARRYLLVTGGKNHEQQAGDLLQTIKNKYQKKEWNPHVEHAFFLIQYPQILEDLSWAQLKEVIPSSVDDKIQEELHSHWVKARKAGYDKNIQIVLDAYGNEVKEDSIGDPLELGKAAVQALQAALDAPGGLKKIPSTHFKNILRIALPLSFSPEMADDLRSLFHENFPQVIDHIKESASTQEENFGRLLSKVREKGGPSSQEFYDYAREENELRYILAVAVSQLQEQIAYRKEKKDEDEVQRLQEIIDNLIPYSEDVHFRTFLMFKLYTQANRENWLQEFDDVRNESKAVMNQKTGMDFDHYGRYGAIGDALDEFMKYERDLKKYPQRKKLHLKAMDQFQHKISQSSSTGRILFQELKEEAKLTATFPPQEKVEGPTTNIYQEMTMFRSYFENSIANPGAE